MNNNKIPPISSKNYSDLPSTLEERHSALVDAFGQWICWHRNQALNASKTFVESESARQNIGTIRRKPYDNIASMTPDQKEASLLFAKETLNGFLERLLWSFGDEGIDCRFDDKHAYRFRIEMEIVDAHSGDIIEEHAINRGGKFFGKNWGRWLNQCQET